MNEPPRPCPGPPPAAGPRRALAFGRARAQAGFTLLETAVASALLVLFLTSLFALNSAVMRMLRSANETAYASQELQCRVEQVRLANWSQVTDPAAVTELLKTPTDATLDLPGLVETLMARPYTFEAPEQNPAFKLRRNADASISPSSEGPAATGDNLADPNVGMIRVDLTVNWQGWGGRARTRSLTTVVSRWGVSK